MTTTPTPARAPDGVDLVPVVEDRWYARDFAVLASLSVDDGNYDLWLDAERVLAGMSDQELLDLREDRFSGEQGDYIAYDQLVGRHPEVIALFTYRERADVGFTVQVDVDAAEAWIAQHRPHLALPSQEPAAVDVGPLCDLSERAVFLWFSLQALSCEARVAGASAGATWLATELEAFARAVDSAQDKVGVAVDRLNQLTSR